jgi:sugar (pentulose or hexulose) kinase
VALAPEGTAIARASAAYPTDKPAPGACEQAPQNWIAAVESVAAQLRTTVGTQRWRAIGLSAMIPTLVTGRPGGEPAGLAITWQDSRGDGRGEQLRERCGGDQLYRATGQWVDGRYLLPMYLRLADDEPALAATVTRLLGAKEYLFGWLTGEIATDPSSAAGYGCYQLAAGVWDGEVLAAAAELARPAVPALPSMPSVLPSTTCWPLRGETAQRLGCGRIPVCLGAADSVLGAFGLGVRDSGQVAYIAGTSSVILGVTSRLMTDPDHRFLVTPLAEPGHWGLEMDLLATGSAISWLAGLFGAGMDEAALVALAADVDPRDAPLVLPYLSPGEQGALWDPLLRGAFLGLELRHGRSHLARGLVNGILLESRRCLAALDETWRFSRVLNVGGSSAASPAFRADLAAATGRRVDLPSGHDAYCSARGAALLAALAVDGVRPAQADGRPGPGSQPASPAAEANPHRAAMWDEIWASYDQACRAITGYYHAGLNPR